MASSGLTVAAVAVFCCAALYRLGTQKKKLLVLVQKELNRHRPRLERGGSSTWTSVLGSFLPLQSLGIGGSVAAGRLAQDAQILAEEIRATEELSRHLFLELVDLREARDRELAARTCRGRVNNLFGHVLVCVCIFKIGAASFNIVYGQRNRVDPVTRIMAAHQQLTELTNHTNEYIGFRDQNEREFWSQFVSFVLVSIIIVSSIRHVLQRLMQFFSVLSSYLSTSSLVLLLAQLMGMYFLSLVLLMRMNLAEGYRRIITEVLGDVPFEYYHRWFDVLYLFSALATCVLLGLHSLSVRTIKLAD